MNQQMTPQTGSSEQMKQMRVIMYLMPLMFMFVLNSFPSGLTYYYFLIEHHNLLYAVGYS